MSKFNKKDIKWYEHYELAKRYYDTYGNLEIKESFITKDGISYDKEGFHLGYWIIKLRTTKKYSNSLDYTRVRLLDEIGMIWDFNEDRWYKYYKLAKNYYLHNHNLNIPDNFKTKDGVTEDKEGLDIGIWLSSQKQAYKGVGTCKIDSKQVKLLEKIGIVWYVIETNWMKKYELAKKYYEKYGNLEVPMDFKTKDGINEDKNGLNIGNWIRTLRSAYKGKSKSKISSKQIELLNKIGMIWEYDALRNWIEYYELAKKYYEKYGNLRIRFDFKTKDGIKEDKNGKNLGNWIVAQRRIRRGLRSGRLDENQINLLNEIGMIWEFENKTILIENATYDDIWLAKYNLVKNYYKKYGNLDIPKDFKTKDGVTFDNEGINIYTWLRTQKEAYKGNGDCKFTYERIELLEKLNISWFKDSIDKKLQRAEITDINKKYKEVEILNRFKSYLLKYDGNTLPSKEEINSNFVKVLSKGDK